MILIRTRPRGAEVKASFLLDVSTKAPSAFARAHIREMHIYTYYTYIYERGAFPRRSRKRTLVFLLIF